MKTELTKGYVIYWQYPNDKKQRNTRAYATKEDADRMLKQLSADGMHINSVQWRD